MDRCTDTTFFLGPIAGSVFFRDCKNCKISVACSQFRCRDLYDSEVYLYAANDPVIESSANLTFAPYNLAYPQLKEHAAKANLDPEVNKWELIFDFTTQADGSLNYKVMDPSQWQMQNKTVEGLGEPEVAFAYPQRYGGTVPDDVKFASSAEDGGGMMAFGFDHSAAQAEMLFQQQQEQPVEAVPDSFDPFADAGF